MFAWVYVTAFNGTLDLDQLRNLEVVLSYGHSTLICVNKAQIFVEQNAIPDAAVGAAHHIFCVWVYMLT